jgi:hypothetical protein
MYDERVKQPTVRQIKKAAKVALRSQAEAKTAAKNAVRYYRMDARFEGLLRAALVSGKARRVLEAWADQPSDRPRRRK